jgi:hypothetical protein
MSYGLKCRGSIPGKGKTFLYVLHPVVYIKYLLLCQHNSYLRSIQMNLYIKAINLKGTTCFDPY